MAVKTMVKQPLTLEQRQKKMAAQIERKNARFESMTPEQRRVAIAKDALKQIEVKRYRPLRGHYVVGSEFFDKNIVNDSRIGEQQVCTVMSDNMPSCQVCARGALFLSSITLFDKLRVNSLPTLRYRFDNRYLYTSLDNIDLCGADMQVQERKFFSKQQITLIETAFEGSVIHGNSNGLTEVQIEAAELFSKNYKNSNNRLIAILKNIIKNKGEFVLPQRFIKKAEDRVKHWYD